MRRQDNKARLVDIDQHHHHAVCVACIPFCLAQVIAVIDRGFIAVMSVRDEELMPGKRISQGCTLRLVAFDPQAVSHTVGIGECNVRAARRHAVDFRRNGVLVVDIHGIHLAEVAAGGHHQVKTVLFCFGKRFFVRQYDPFGELLQHNARNDAAQGIGSAADGEFLLVDIESVAVADFQNALVQPFLQCGGGIVIPRCAIARRQLQTDCVVRFLLIEPCLLGRRDDIIRRAAELCQLRRTVFMKHHCAKRSYFGHTFTSKNNFGLF